jgi:hypothetical protein
LLNICLYKQYIMLVFVGLNCLFNLCVVVFFVF